MNFQSMIQVAEKNLEIKARVKFNVEAGILTRKQIKNFVQSQCLFHELELEVFEDKGILNTFFTFIVKGEGKKLLPFLRKMAQIEKELT